MKSICINGVSLAYEEYGTGDKYLLSTQNFFFRNCHMALLGQPPYDYHCYLIYTRGYAGSQHIFDPEPQDYTKIWGEDVVAFAKTMGISNFFYSGISHGNWAGWYIAFHYPELLRGFVCCDGICQYKSEKTGNMPQIQRNWMDIENTVGNRDALEKIAWQETWPTQNTGRLKRRAENHQEHLNILLDRKKEEFTVRNNNMTACDASSEEDFYNKLSQLHFPLMLLNGVLDPLSRVEDALKIAKVVPGCQLLTIQHWGHGGPDECPEITARICDRFFKDTENEIL